MPYYRRTLGSGGSTIDATARNLANQALLLAQSDTLESGDTVAAGEGGNALGFAWTNPTTGTLTVPTPLTVANMETEGFTKDGALSNTVRYEGAWDLATAYDQNDIVLRPDGKLYRANDAIPNNTAFAEGTTGATWSPVSAGEQWWDHVGNSTDIQATTAQNGEIFWLIGSTDTANWPNGVYKEIAGAWVQQNPEDYGLGGSSSGGGTDTHIGNSNVVFDGSHTVTLANGQTWTVNAGATPYEFNGTTGELTAGSVPIGQFNVAGFPPESGLRFWGESAPADLTPPNIEGVYFGRAGFLAPFTYEMTFGGRVSARSLFVNSQGANDGLIITNSAVGATSTWNITQATSSIPAGQRYNMTINGAGDIEYTAAAATAYTWQAATNAGGFVNVNNTTQGPLQYLATDDGSNAAIAVDFTDDISPIGYTALVIQGHATRAITLDAGIENSASLNVPTDPTMAVQVTVEVIVTPAGTRKVAFFSDPFTW